MHKSLRHILILAVFSLLCVFSVNSKIFEFKLCQSTSEFWHTLNMVCFMKVRKSLDSAPIQSKENAHNFLRGIKFKRSHREPSRPTDYYEECCNEGCKAEEVLEYC